MDLFDNSVGYRTTLRSVRIAACTVKKILYIDKYLCFTKSQEIYSCGGFNRVVRKLQFLNNFR